MNSVNSIFKGDGRRSLKPINSPEGTKPIPVTRAVARSVVNSFVRTGYSYHSVSGSTLWILVTYCKENNIPFEVKGGPNRGGWVIQIANQP